VAKAIKFVVMGSVALLLIWGTVTGVIPWRRILGISRTVVGNAAHTAGQAAGNLSTGGGPSNVGGPAAATQCRENLTRIHTAKLSIRSKTGIEVKDVSWDAVVKEMGGRMPKCPSGGTYSIGTMQSLPSCSVGANGNTDGTDDHQIRK